MKQSQAHSKTLSANTEDRFRPVWAAALLLAGLVAGLLSASALAQQSENLAARINKGTVGIISGGVDGTYIRIATDLASVLDKGDQLRVVPIVGKGSIQNIADILYLRGIDIGIVQSDVLAHIRRENIYPNIEQKVSYITKLYNEEFHLLVSRDIQSVQDLAGRQVNFGVAGSGTFMTASIVFDTLGVDARPVSLDQALALERLKTGELAGMVYVAGKPARIFSDVTADDGVRLLPVPYSPELLETYLPSRFSSDDYPRLLSAGETVDTVAVGAVMAVYDWKPGTPRYVKVARFVDAFFDRFGDFQMAPRHRKWLEVSLTAELPGWKRFAPAADALAKAKGAN